MPMFIELNKTTQVSNIKPITKIQNLTITKIINIYYTLQKTRIPQEETVQERIKELFSNKCILV
jgi:hypothetical protein